MGNCTSSAKHADPLLQKASLVYQPITLSVRGSRFSLREITLLNPLCACCRCWRRHRSRPARSAHHRCSRARLSRQTRRRCRRTRCRTLRGCGWTPRCRTMHSCGRCRTATRPPLDPFQSPCTTILRAWPNLLLLKGSLSKKTKEGGFVCRSNDRRMHYLQWVQSCTLTYKLALASPMHGMHALQFLSSHASLRHGRCTVVTCSEILHPHYESRGPHFQKLRCVRWL